MSMLDHTEHLLGILSLVTIGIIAGSLHLAIYVIVDAIRPQWRRILAVLRGEHLPGAAAVTPAHLITSVERGFARGKGRE